MRERQHPDVGRCEEIEKEHGSGRRKQHGRIREDIKYAANVPLRNLSKPLENEVTEENMSQNQEKEKEERVPPIIMPSEGLDYKLFLTELKKIAGIDQFRIQHLKRNVQIFSRDMSICKKTIERTEASGESVLHLQTEARQGKKYCSRDPRT